MEYYLSYFSYVVIPRVLIIKVSYGSFFFRQVLWLNNTRFHTGVKCWKLILRSGAHPTQSLTCCRGDVIEIKFWRFTTFVLTSQFFGGVSGTREVFIWYLWIWYIGYIYHIYIYIYIYVNYYILRYCCCHFNVWKWNLWNAEINEHTELFFFWLIDCQGPSLLVANYHRNSTSVNLTISFL